MLEGYATGNGSRSNHFTWPYTTPYYFIMLINDGAFPHKKSNKDRLCFVTRNTCNPVLPDFSALLPDMNISDYHIKRTQL